DPHRATASMAVEHSRRLRHHRRRYSRRELTAKTRAAGLELARVTSFVTLLLPLMAASRVLQRHRTAFDPASEFRTARRLTAPLAGAMRAEEALIRRGLSLPTGGSLLAVARRPV